MLSLASFILPREWICWGHQFGPDCKEPLQMVKQLEWPFRTELYWDESTRLVHPWAGRLFYVGHPWKEA